MSKCIIGFGKCSKYLLYILGTVVFKLLNYFIFDKSIYSQKKEESTFKYIPILFNHNYIQSLLKYLSYIIGGIIFEYILYKKTKTEKNPNINNNDNINNSQVEEEKDRSSSNSILIFNKQNEHYKIKKLENFLICSSYTLSREIVKISNIFHFNTIEIWTLEVLFILYFLKRNFDVNLYNFKKLSLFIILVPTTILLIISSILPYAEDGEKKNVYEKIKEITGNHIYIIPIEISFLLSELFSAYSKVKSKVLMDLRYLSPYLIIIYIGIIGFILSFIALVITPFIKCDQILCDKICKVEDNGNFYLDNALVYFQTMKESGYEIYMEIFVVFPFFLLINFFQFFCQILVIYYFNPYFILLRDNIYFFFIRLFIIIIYGKNFQEHISLTQFIILECSEIISIIAFLIYLEIIELRFCGLDMHLKKNLLIKSEEETRYKSDDKNNKLVNSMSTENHDDDNSEVNLRD